MYKQQWNFMAINDEAIERMIELVENCEENHGNQ